MRLRRVTEIWISTESENKFACKSLLAVPISVFICSCALDFMNGICDKQSTGSTIQ